MSMLQGRTRICPLLPRAGAANSKLPTARLGGLELKLTGECHSTDCGHLYIQKGTQIQVIQDGHRKYDAACAGAPAQELRASEQRLAAGRTHRRRHPYRCQSYRCLSTVMTSMIDMAQ